MRLCPYVVLLFTIATVGCRTPAPKQDESALRAPQLCDGSCQLVPGNVLFAYVGDLKQSSFPGGKPAAVLIRVTVGAQTNEYEALVRKKANGAWTFNAFVTRPAPAGTVTAAELCAVGGGCEPLAVNDFAAQFQGAPPKPCKHCRFVMLDHRIGLIGRLVKKADPDASTLPLTDVGVLLRLDGENCGEAHAYSGWTYEQDVDQSWDYGCTPGTPTSFEAIVISSADPEPLSLVTNP